MCKVYRGILSKVYMFNEDFVKECASIVNRDDVKREMKRTLRPVIDLVLTELYPYIYVSLMFVCVSFLLTLAIFVLLIRKNIVHASG